MWKRSHVKDKVLLFPTDTVSGSLKYALDRSEKDLGLPDLTKACLDNFTETAKKGFFMMVEGGKIDWAAHAHDAATVVTETIDFDQCYAENENSQSRSFLGRDEIFSEEEAGLLETDYDYPA